MSLYNQLKIFAKNSSLKKILLILVWDVNFYPEGLNVSRYIKKS